MTTEPTPAHPASESTPTAPADAASTAITATPAPLVPPTMETPAPATSQPEPDWALRTDYFLLGLLLVLSFFVASFTATNTDLWMHLAVGKRINEGQFEFGVDPYSWATEATDKTP